MNWFGWVMAVLILGGTVWVWVTLNDPKHGVAGCCGCGQCAVSGKCVLMKRKKDQKKEEDPS